MTLDNPVNSLSRHGGWSPRLVISLISILLVMEAVGLPYLIAATVQRAAAETFHTSSGGWMLTAFALGGAIACPVFGKLADLHGKRRMLMISLGCAIAGDLLAALAPQFWVLVVGQALHGFIVPCYFLGYSLMRDIYPRRVIPFATSVSLTGTGVLATFVPFAVGYVLDNHGFRALFLMDACYVLVIAVVVLVITPESPRRLPAKLDLVGAVLIAAGIGILLLGVSMGSHWGWASVATIGSFVVAVILLVAFGLWSSRRDEPVLDLRTFRRRPVLFAAVTAGASHGNQPLIQVLLPMLAMTPAALALGYGLGANASTYAWVSATLALSQVVGGVIVGLVVRVIGARASMYVGLVLQGAGAVTVFFLHGSLGQLIIAATVFGLGSGFSYGATPSLVMAASPADQQGSISAAVQGGTAIVGSITPVVAYAVLAPGGTLTRTGSSIYTSTAMGHALLLPAGLALLAIVIGALFLRVRAGDARPGGTEVPEPATEAAAPRTSA